MFEFGIDGSAIAFNIPISPFVPLHHGVIDVVSVHRLANFGLRFAVEQGWCSTTHIEKISETDEEGHVVDDSDTTVFYAGVDAELSDKSYVLHEGFLPASVFFEGHFWISHVGTSSYGVYGKIFRYEAHDRDNKLLVGEFRVVIVSVSKSKRKPMALTNERQKILQQSIEKHNFTTQCSRLERIHIIDALQSSGLFKDDTCTQFIDALPTHPLVAPLTTAYQRTFDVRETDIDFNKHVNQLAMIQLVINAFRSAVGDTSTVFPRLLDEGLEPLFSDILIRRLRTDYVREIPFSGASKIMVTLFLKDESSMKSIISSSIGNRHKALNEIWFVAHALLSDNSSPFVSVVGKFFVLS